MDNADICLARAEAKKLIFMVPFLFIYLLHLHVVISIVCLFVFFKLLIEIERKAHLIRNNVFVIWTVLAQLVVF